MHKIIELLRNNAKIKKALYFLNILFLGLYSFSIPSFSGRGTYNLLSYGFMALLIVFAISYAYLYKTFNFKFRLLVVPIFVMVALVGTLIFSKAYRSWITLVLLSITFFIFYIAFNNVDNKFFSLTILSIGFFVFALYFLFIYRAYLIQGIKGQYRLGSYFANVNEIGGYCFVGFISSISLVLFSKYKFKYFAIIIALSLLFVGYLTGSRAFLVNVFFSCIVFAYLKLKNHKLVFWLSLIALIAFGVILINMPFMKEMKEKMVNAFTTASGNGTGKIDSSTFERILWQKYGIYLGSKNLLFGYGCSGFSIYSGVGTYTHGNFAELLCNFGITGSTAFHLMFLIPSILLIIKKDNDSYFGFCFIVYELLMSILGINYYHKDIYIVLALLYYLTKDIDFILFKQKNLVYRYEVQI